jgi:hypothetical protein
MYRTAAVLVPVLMIIPMGAVLAWQLINWWWPASLHTSPSFLDLLPMARLRCTPPDAPLLVGGVTQVLAAAITAVLLVRLNHRALRAIRTGTRGVRIAP